MLGRYHLLHQNLFVIFVCTRNANNNYRRTMENTILKKAINHLEEATGLNADWRAKPQNSIDGYLVLERDRHQYRFPVEVKK